MDVYKIRVQSLLSLQARRFRGRQTDLARAVHRSPAQINQWISGVRRIREDSARMIESNLGLPNGWMDQPSQDGSADSSPALPAAPDSLSDLERRAVHALRGLTVEQQEIEVARLLDLRAQNERVHAHFTIINQPLPPDLWSFRNQKTSRRVERAAPSAKKTG
jgi:hypothetical protein